MIQHRRVLALDVRTSTDPYRKSQEQTWTFEEALVGSIEDYEFDETETAAHAAAKILSEEKSNG